VSVEQIALAWASGVPPIDRLVLLALADWSDKAGRTWPSIPQLASKTGIHERTVRLALGRLEGGGHLTRRSLPGKGTRYRLTIQPVDTPGATPTPGAEPTPGVTPTPGVAPGTPGAAPTNTSAIRQERKKASPSPSTRARSTASVGGGPITVGGSTSDGGSTRVSPQPGTPARAIDLPPLPPGASDQQWADYVEVRVAMARADKKRPWTPTTARKAIEKLTALAAAGEDPGAVLDQSVLNTWQGLFPVKDDRNGRRGQPLAAGAGARGPRPDPALDLLYAARAAEAAEGAPGDWQDDCGAWPSLPTDRGD